MDKIRCSSSFVMPILIKSDINNLCMEMCRTAANVIFTEDSSKTAMVVK